MALLQPATVAETGATFPAAYGRIDDWLLVPGTTRVNLSWYVDAAAAAAGHQPIRDPDVVFIDQALLATPNPTFVSALQQHITAGAVNSPDDALMTALYLVLKQLPAYAAATDA